MSEERYKVLEKAKKLKELAVRGVDGEMENAKVMLDSYMKKHNITEDELDSSSRPSSYADMTDDEFLREIIKEFIPIGLGAIFARFGKAEINDYSNAQIGQFVHKILTEMSNRVEKKTKKK